MEEVRKLLAENAAGVLLYGFYGKTDAVLWGYDHMEMDMNCINTNLGIVPVGVEFAHFLQLDAEIGGHSGGEDFSAESGHPDYMVLSFVDGVRLFVEFHAYSLYWKTRDMAHIPA